MPFGIGPVELLLVLGLALIILGPGKLPEVGSSLGRTLREFRKASTDIEDAARIDVAPARPARASTSTVVTDSADATTPTSPVTPATTRTADES